jgi:hypothetical protein
MRVQRGTIMNNSESWEEAYEKLLGRACGAAHAFAWSGHQRDYRYVCRKRRRPTALFDRQDVQIPLVGSGLQRLPLLQQHHAAQCQVE